MKFQHVSTPDLTCRSCSHFRLTTWSSPLHQPAMGSGASAEKEPEEPEPEIQITDLSEEEKKRLDEAVKQVTNAAQMKLFPDLITILAHKLVRLDKSDSRIRHFLFVGNICCYGSPKNNRLDDHNIVQV